LGKRFNLKETGRGLFGKSLLALKPLNVKRSVMRLAKKIQGGGRLSAGVEGGGAKVLYSEETSSKAKLLKAEEPRGRRD